MRDQQASTAINLKIIRPGDSVVYNWNFDFTNTYNSSWWYWYYNGIFDEIGTWKWQATYQGKTVTHTFEITSSLNTETNTLNAFNLHPNPFNNIINISSKNAIEKVTVFDTFGKEILTVNDNSIDKIELNQTAPGLYFIRLEDINKNTKIMKIIKKQP